MGRVSFKKDSFEKYRQFYDLVSFQTTQQGTEMCITTQRTQGSALRVGTFNCRGLKQDLKKCNLLQDLESYKLDILTVQETHMKGGVIKIKSRTGRNYDFYYGGVDNIHKGKVNGGVGIIVSQELKTEFKCITDRICLATVCVGNRKHSIISACAPTWPISENPSEIRTFIEILTVAYRVWVTIGGDFKDTSYTWG